MKNKLIPSILACLALATTSNAAIIATEYFNGYGPSNITTDVVANTAGGSLTGGTGWDTTVSTTTSHGWFGADAQYIAGTNLTYGGPGYSNSGNLSGASDGAMGFANTTGGSITMRTFTSSATTLWISALVSVTGATSALMWIDSFPTASNSQDFVGILSGNFQARYNAASGGIVGTPTVATANVTHLLLAKVDIDYIGTFDRLSFWFNPTLTGGEGGLGTAYATADGADTFGTAINGVGLQLSDGSIADAIRVGTTFADVIPEPSTALLGGLGMLALLRRRR